jgi:HEPN domain-containing protein
MVRTFYRTDGFDPVDFAHCGLDHMTAAKLLFDSDASHFDSAGYLAHIGVELVLKAWLLQVSGQFKGIHILSKLYGQLESECGAPKLEAFQVDIMNVLDQYEQLRYPNPKQPTEVGEDDWPQIEGLVGFICRTMPQEIPESLERVAPDRKAGRVLMHKRI